MKDAAADAAAPKSRLLFRLLLATIGILFLYGATLRFWRLGTPSLWIDEGFSIRLAQAVQRTGYPVLSSGRAFWSYAPVHYLMAIGLALFDDLEWGGRFFSALAGTLAIPALYWLSLRMTRRRGTAALAVCLFSLHVYQVAWARQARGYALLQLAGILALALCLGWERRLHRQQAILLILLLGLSVLIHPAGYLYVCMCCLLLASNSRVGNSTAIRAFLARSWRHGLLSGAALLLLLCAALLFRSNSSLWFVLSELSRTSESDYLPAYALFFWGQLRFLLCWMAAGAILGLKDHWRHTLPLIGGMLLYLYALSFRIPLFHFRYLLPIYPLSFIFVALGAQGAIGLFAHARSPLVRRLGMISIVASFAIAVPLRRFIYAPRAFYDLGPTAPQPDWEAGFQWVMRDWRDQGRSATALATISAFPMFHDFYIGSTRGTKYFLPFSISSRAGHARLTCEYSDAQVIRNLADLRAAEGYIILDSFSLPMLISSQIKDYCMSCPPDKVIEGHARSQIFIWRNWEGAEARVQTCDDEPGRSEPGEASLASTYLSTKPR